MKKNKIIFWCVIGALILMIIVCIILLNINLDSTNILMINDKEIKESTNENLEVIISDNDNFENVDEYETNYNNIYEYEVDYYEENNNINEENDEEINNNFSSDVLYDEEDVVAYFEEIESEVDTSTSFKDKFKEYFITIVDFIFYEGEIKGVSFNELSSVAKTKIISIALKVDNKIEDYIPNYKENISSTSGRIYNNVKEKLVSLFVEISSDVCSKNENECAKVKEIFNDIKDVCKIGWEYIKKLTKKGFTSLKDWYELYSGK